MVLVGVESPAKSSRGNLLKISTRPSDLAFSGEARSRQGGTPQGERGGWEEEERIETEIDLIT